MVVEAKDDFYTHVNEDWLAVNPVPGDYSRWGTFEELVKINDEQIRSILNDKGEESSEWESVQILWNKGKDEDALNGTGFGEILKSQFEAINNINSIESLVEFFIDCYRSGISVPLTLGPHPDLKNSDFMILYIDRCSGGLGLQDRDVYFDDAMKEKREKYKEYLVILTNHIKSQVSASYLKDTEDVYRLEERLAEACLPKVDRREPSKMYNPHDYKQLADICPSIKWESVIGSLNITLKEGEFIVVKEIEFLKRLNLCLQEVPLETWKHYMAIRLMSSTAKHLDDTSSSLRHDFYGKVMSGQKEQKPRWKRVYYTINNLIGEIVGKKYVVKYFPSEYKEQVMDMIHRMMNVLEGRIKALPWMENATKEKALKKLGTFAVKIGYPDKWDDFSGLSLSDHDSYCANVLACERFDTVKQLAKCYKAVDKTEWHMTPQTVNAYYNPTQNEIVFPAGIIQPPMYDGSALIAFNFGGIGAVICHEITHGFDDKGAKFNHAGNLENWWTEADEKKFEACAEKLQTHFSEYVVEGMNVKGDLCLGENIADLGGLSISLEALKLMMEEKNASKEDIEEQMKNVFKAWGMIWRNNIKPEEAKRRIIMDPHSPGPLRVNGIVKQLDTFYELFGVTENDPMYIQPENRAKIW